MKGAVEVDGCWTQVEGQLSEGEVQREGGSAWTLLQGGGRRAEVNGGREAEGKRERQRGRRLSSSPSRPSPSSPPPP